MVNNTTNVNKTTCMCHLSTQILNLKKTATCHWKSNYCLGTGANVYC